MKKEDLENLLLCMIIMSYIDGFDSEEFDLINKVFKEVYQGSAGELEELMENGVKDVAEYNADGTMKDKFESCTKALATSLEPEQKKLVLGLMMKLIKADNKITGEETDLYMKFKQFILA